MLRKFDTEWVVCACMCTFGVNVQVRWQGYTANDDTYEPFANVHDCGKFIKYLRDHPKVVERIFRHVA